MSPGTSLGHYRIIGPLGKGGMGEVFAAEDTRLKRKVALKVLPEDFANDAERRKRLEREAQAVAALNHPNIVTVHSIEEFDGTLFVTMEVIDGQTLRDRLARGPLPLEQLLATAVAISDALAAAHLRGITHRDLKPANVMVTPEGRVKVLDFGLAKVETLEWPSSADASTTLTSDPLTGIGRVAGTIAYMSPEQAEGRPLDQRSDIFSLGVMLHELATGERPFKGDSELSIISAILKETPSSITDINPKLPEGLARIVRRCLSKQPDRRYQTALDIRNDLEELSTHQREQGTDGRLRGSTKVRRTRWLLPAGVLVMVSGTYLSFANWGDEAEPARIERLRQLTSGGIARLAALSPDGRYVVHVNRDNGLSALIVRQTAASGDVRIAEPARGDYGGVAFSPDGNFIYYILYPEGSSLATLYRMPTLGGVPIPILENVDTATSFSPDGSRLAFVRGDVATGINSLMTAAPNGDGLVQLSAPSGTERLVASTPAWSPDGKTILVPAEEQEYMKVMAVDASSGEAKEHSRWIIVQSVQWLPDGKSYVVSGLGEVATTPQLWQVPYPSGDRHRLTNDLSAYLGASVSADGKQLVAVQAKTQSAIWLAGMTGQAPAPLSIGHMEAPGEYGLRWLSDSRLLFTSQTGGSLNLWTVALDGSAPKQITSGELLAQTPFYSLNQKAIYFTGVAEKGLSIARIDADGRNLRFVAKGNAFGPVVSPNGDWVYYTTRKSGMDVSMRMRGDGTEQVQTTAQGFESFDISPDGRLLIGRAWNDSGKRLECGLLPVNGGSVQFLGIAADLNGARTSSCRWHPSTGAVTFLAWREERLAVFAKSPDGAAEERLLTFPEGPRVNFHTAWAPDGKLAVARGEHLSDVVLISLR